MKDSDSDRHQVPQVTPLGLPASWLRSRRDADQIRAGSSRRAGGAHPNLRGRRRPNLLLRPAFQERRYERGEDGNRADNGEGRAMSGD